jgi:hypothetical protein
MCDYSLHAVESRPAEVGEKLISTSFRCSSTRGFATRDNRGVAICLLPGTELAFEEEVRFYQMDMGQEHGLSRGAILRRRRASLRKAPRRTRISGWEESIGDAAYQWPASNGPSASR